MYVKVTLILLLLDYLWLSATQRIYVEAAERIQRQPVQFNKTAAALAYACLIALLVQILRWDAGMAGWIGLLVYGIYNFTTLALLRDYSWGVALMDTAWGGVLFGTTAWLANQA